MNRTLNESARCMVSLSSMADVFLADFLLSAVKARNCTPEGTNQITPEEERTGQIPNVCHS